MFKLTPPQRNPPLLSYLIQTLPYFSSCLYSPASWKKCFLLLSLLSFVHPVLCPSFYHSLQLIGDNALLTDFSAAFYHAVILCCLSCCSISVSAVGSSFSAHYSSKATFPSIFSPGSLLFSMHIISLRDIICSSDSNNQLYPADPAQCLSWTYISINSWLDIHTWMFTNSLNSNCPNLN